MGPLDLIKLIISKANFYYLVFAVCFQTSVFYLDLSESKIIKNFQERYPPTKQLKLTSISHNAGEADTDVYLHNILLTTSFYFVHTLIIILNDKYFSKRTFGNFWYDNFYKFISSLHLMYIYKNYKPINDVIFEFPKFLTIPLYLTHFLGLYLVYHSPGYLGKWVSKNPGKVCKEGIFAYIRHPTYLGMFMIYLGRPVYTIGSALFGVLQCSYCVIAVFWNEEPRMVRLFGKQYEQYVEEVPALCPLKFGASKNKNKKE